jgi:hypothetical protein
MRAVGLAFAGVADCYNALAYMNFLSPTDAFPKAKAAAAAKTAAPPNSCA